MENSQALKHIEFEVSKLNADILLTEAEIANLVKINNTRAAIIDEYNKQKELLTALQTH